MPLIDVLLVRSGAWLVALRVEDVIETFRPLPVEPVAGAPPFVRGVARVRGAPTPVVELSTLLGAGAAGRGDRFVSVRAGQRLAVLEVGAVIGVRQIPDAALDAAPPLLGSAVQVHVDALGTLDGQLLAVLDASRLLPDDTGPEACIT